MAAGNNRWISHQTCSCHTGKSWPLSLLSIVQLSTWSWQGLKLSMLNLLWLFKALLNITIMQTPLQWLCGRQRGTGITFPRFTYYGSHLQHWVFDWGGALKLVDSVNGLPPLTAGPRQLHIGLIFFFTKMYGTCLPIGRHVDGKEQLIHIQLQAEAVAHGGTMSQQIMAMSGVFCNTLFFGAWTLIRSVWRMHCRYVGLRVCNLGLTFPHQAEVFQLVELHIQQSHEDGPLPDLDFRNGFKLDPRAAGATNLWDAGFKQCRSNSRLQL